MSAALQILLAAAARPSLFHWAGPIAPEQLRAWTVENRLRLPGDLEHLLLETGGGDVFESETILRPFGGIEIGDNASTTNASHHGQGMSHDLWLFHVGLVLSALERSSGTLLTLSPAYRILARYESVERWYAQVLRAEYAERYGLPPVERQPI